MPASNSRCRRNSAVFFWMTAFAGFQGVAEPMKVFLTGATGFVGSHLLRRLLRDGYHVRALVRANKNIAPGRGTLEQVEGDLSSKELAGYMAGCDAAINLVGIIREQGSSTFETVHHLGTLNLVNAARKAGVRRFVQMSALGARASNATTYHLTKFAAEEEVRKSEIPFVILRPSLIFGPGSAFIQQMIAIMKAVPFVRPVAGTGEYRFQPIHIDDVIECFTQSLTNAKAGGKTIELIAVEQVTLNEINDAIAACTKVAKIPVHIPMPLMKAAAMMFSVLPIKPPVTIDQLRMLEEGSVADSAQMRETFNITPAGFREALKNDFGSL